MFTISAILCTISGLLSGNDSLTWGIAGIGLFGLVVVWRFIKGSSASLFVKAKPDEAECIIA